MSAQNILSSRSSQWFTPPAILDLEREALGGDFDLDPASCALAQKLVRAETWLDRDGLSTPWLAERLHLNPPYSKKDGGPLDPWLRKAIKANDPGEDLSDGAVVSGCILLNATPERSWFRLLWRHTTVAFLHERVSFLEPVEQALDRWEKARGGDFKTVEREAQEDMLWARGAALDLPEGLTLGPHPTHGNVVAYIGEDPFRFERAFKAYATIVPRGTAR